jgi:hypothetical protein
MSARSYVQLLGNDILNEYLVHNFQLRRYLIIPIKHLNYPKENQATS